MHTRFGLLAALLVAACGTPQPSTSKASERAPTPARFAALELGEAAAYRHGAELDGRYRMPENLGPGVALFDYDDDGDLDLYLVDGGRADLPSPNRLLRQEIDGSFVDVTAAAGVGDPGYGMGVAIGDANGDGTADIFVANVGSDRLYLSRGDGAYDVGELPLAVSADVWSTSATFCDVDGDRDLDLFIATYVDYDRKRSCTDAAGRAEYCGPLAFPGVADLLLENRGDGTFTDHSEAAGVAAVASRGLGVVCHDLDGDGLADLFVANDGEENDLWLNRGDGSFGEEALAMGTAVNSLGQPEASMGIALGDVDGDLDLDLFLTHLDRETNTLYRNLGSVGFEDATATTGLGPVSLPYTGFGVALLDSDRDGDLDLLLANGKVRRGASPASIAVVEQARRAGVPELLREYAEPNLLLDNVGGRFDEATSTCGELCTTVEVSRGLAVGDVDRDGGPDVAVAQCAGPIRVFRSTLSSGPWLAVRPVLASGADALGAEVEVEAAGRRQVRPVIAGSSYLSSSEPTALFGLGASAELADVRVSWPDGRATELAGAPANRVLTVYVSGGHRR